MTDRLRNIPITVLNDGDISAEIPLGGEILVGIHMPATWVSAAISFQAATVSGGTFQDVYNELNVQVSIPAATGARFIALPPNFLMGVQFIKVRSGLTGAVVDQTADRILTLVTRQAS